MVFFGIDITAEEIRALALAKNPDLNWPEWFMPGRRVYYVFRRIKKNKTCKACGWPYDHGNGLRRQDGAFVECNVCKGKKPTYIDRWEVSDRFIVRISADFGTKYTFINELYAGGVRMEDVFPTGEEAGEECRRRNEEVSVRTASREGG